MDANLYNQLFEVRSKLKNKNKSKGKTPVICTDESLREMARLAPKNKNELQCVAGLGAIFVEKYGEAFMKVLSSYHRDNMMKNKVLQPEVRSTLENLEQRLVNISKKNRLLHMPRLSTKYAADLFIDGDVNHNRDIVNFLLRNGKYRGKSIKLASLNIKSKNYEQEEARYNKLLSLVREATKDFRESGQFDLYIGYPFVIGRLQGEDFNVRAPLALFPVQIERNSDYISVALDESKDILYNNNLILLHNKFNNVRKDLPPNTVEDLRGGSFVKDLITFYKDNGIKIRGEVDELIKFEEYHAGAFPFYKRGEYDLSNTAVIGKFSLYSNFLQKDFKDILDKSEINELLNTLLYGADEIDIFAEEKLEEKNKIPEEQLSFTEGNINYINDLNYSQEKALIKIARGKELVIQGPPGTGKSQTITSIISDFVLRGKNVLMVSQKKAALDVIYSRLGNLSKFAMLVPDTKDKDSFYHQLETVLCEPQASPINSPKMKTLESRVDKAIERLAVIGEEIYSKDSDEAAQFELYQQNYNNSFAKELGETANVCFRAINPYLYDLSYNRLCEIHRNIASENLLKNSIEFLRMYAEYPWLYQIKKSSTRMDIKNMENDASRLSDIQESYMVKSAISRFFSRKSYKSAIKEYAKKYFNRKVNVNAFYGEADKLANSLGCYSQFSKNKVVYDNLRDDEKCYVFAVYKVFEAMGGDINALNRMVFDFVLQVHIDRFETDHRQVFNDIENFDSITEEVDNTMAEKMNYTRQSMKKMLQQMCHLNLINSKRAGEIKRICEGKRKWSVGRFVQKYAFELFKGIRIWLLTPEVVSEILPLENGLFDLLIFDEASQIYIEKGVPAIVRAKKVVVAGDHKQLRPSSLGFGRIEYEEEEDEEVNIVLEEESLLDLARFKYPEVLLNYHYRSKYEELIAFSNAAFYRNRLYVSPNPIDLEVPAIEVIKVHDGLWENRTNRSEAVKTVRLIRNFLEERKEKETIGVITFNSSQRDMIMDILDEECAKDLKFAAKVNKEFDRKQNGEDVGLFVKNIENVQGDERDCIVFSLAYAKTESGKVVRNFGWLNQQGGENRLNVAISRAKKKIYIVTSITPAELKVDDLKNEGPKIFKKYLEYAFAISRKESESAKRILASFSSTSKVAQQVQENEDAFRTHVKKTLEKRGLKVDEQVGIGGYRIDLAIKDPIDGSYVLGIEIDGKLYRNSPNARERDIHRNKYLNSRGWKIYRLWSNKWWHNREEETENILACLKRES